MFNKCSSNNKHVGLLFALLTLMSPMIAKFDPVRKQNLCANKRKVAKSLSANYPSTFSFAYCEECLLFVCQFVVCIL